MASASARRWGSFGDRGGGRSLYVSGATGEGILATGSLKSGSISHVTIQDNRVVGNDLGGIPPSTGVGYPQCEAVGGVPGHRGQGIHLMGVADSVIRDNYDSGNTGGILITDEFGPTHNNLVEDNIVTGNQYDLFANATAGTGSYDNLVEDNHIAGNDLSGVTMHAHTVGPGQFEDLNGNKIVDNVIGQNNLGGDRLDGSQSDPSTTGILVFSGTVPVNVTIAHNVVVRQHLRNLGRRPRQRVGDPGREPVLRSRHARLHPAVDA